MSHDRGFRFRPKSRPVQANWCPAWARSFTGRRTEAVSCQLDRGHTEAHQSTLDRKHTTVTVTWTDDTRPTFRITTKETTHATAG